MAKNTLGLQISHADRDGIDLMLDSLASQDVEAFNTNDNTAVVIAPVNEQVVAAIEDNADDLDIEHARLKIMAVNTDTLQTSPADAIANQFNQQNGYNNGNDYPLSQVYDLVEFILNEADTSKLDEVQKSASQTAVTTTSTAVSDSTVVTSTAAQPNSDQAQAATPSASTVDVPASTAEQTTTGLFDTTPIGSQDTSPQSNANASQQPAPVYDPASGQLMDSASTSQTNQGFDDNFGNSTPDTTNQNNGFTDDFNAGNQQPTSNVNTTTFDDNFGADASQDNTSNNGFNDNFGTAPATPATTTPSSSASDLDLSEWDDFGTNNDQNQSNQGFDQNFNNPANSTPAPQNAPAVDDAAPVSGDELLKRAAKLFDNNYHLTLPDMDEQTRHELMSEYIATKNDLTKIRNQAIYDIRQRLSDIKDKAETSVRQSDLFKNAQKNHDATVKTLKNNLSVDVTNTQTDSEEEYKRNREQWVEAQAPQLRNQYDSEHLANHQTVVRTKIENLKTQAQENIDKENQRFDKYTEDSVKSAVDNYFDHMNIDDILKKANARGRHALNNLQASADKYHSNLAKVQQEREDLKRQLEQTNQLSSQQVKTQVESKALDIKKDYDQQLSNKSKQLKEVQKQLETEQQRNRDMQDVVHDAKVNNEQLATSKQQMQDLIQSLQNAEDKRKENDRQRDRDEQNRQNQQLLQQSLLQQRSGLSGGWKGAIVGTLVAVAGLGCFGAYNVATNHNNQNNQPTVRVREATPAQNSSSASSASSSSSSSSNNDSDAIKPGDTFKYTTSDGDQVTVTADSPHSGHYTDKNGQVKSVLW